MRSTSVFTSVFTVVAMAMALTTTAAVAREKKGEARGKVQTIEMAVTGEGYVPAEIKVKAGRPVKLVITRRTDRTCAKEIVIKELGIDKPLPLDKPVEVTFTPKKAGKLRYACAMDMIAGVLIVE
jgi:plastocyanin domain-containing protein